MNAKDVVKFNKIEYGQLASHARGLIVKDMNDGVLQNGIHQYKSQAYADKKATGALGKYRKSDRVTMLLSGETANRIRPEGKSNKALLIFERGEIVEGNENRGYVIRDLSVKNRNKSVDFLQRIIDRKANKYMSEPININIGK